jgi:tRNA pseudouridine55 synthase
MRAVERVRRLTGTRRAGHAGTLDPAATGVLPVCLGSATRIVTFLLDGDKEYLATVTLGQETDTCDLDGRVVREAQVPPLEHTEVEAALAGFRGTIVQRPPAFSAIRRGGERLYERARRGEDAVAPEREVVVHELELLAFTRPSLEIRVRCGKGTYVRSLAADLGRALGCGGCLASLRRTRVGALALDLAVTLDELADRARDDRVEEVLITPSEALAHIPALRLAARDVDRVRQGQRLAAAQLEEQRPPPDGTVRLLDADGRLVALAELRDGRVQPRTVLA